MSDIKLKVEFLAGTSFKQSLVEAKDLAVKLNVAYVTYNFNGIDVSIGQNASLNMALQDFEDNKKHIVHS